MQYVYVEPDTKHHLDYMKTRGDYSYTAINVGLAENALISLIKAFEPKDFGLHTLPATMKQIKQCFVIVKSGRSNEAFTDSRVLHCL